MRRNTDLEHSDEVPFQVAWWSTIIERGEQVLLGGTGSTDRAVVAGPAPARSASRRGRVLELEQLAEKLLDVTRLERPRPDAVIEPAGPVQR